MATEGHNIVYLLVHYQGKKTHTFIGSTNNFEVCLNEHNSSTQIWQPVLLLKIPDKRNYGIKLLRETWKRNARGLDSRVKYGFKLAKQYKTQVYIHNVDNPILNFLNQVAGEPKDVDESFWQQF